MSKKVILLVEDEAITALMERQELENIGYVVHHVMSGEEAIRMLIDENLYVDLILFDIDLGPGMDGTRAAEEILKHKDLPIIFLSSHTEPEIVEKTEKITSYGYVVKNSGIVVLDASIKMAFRLHRENEMVHQKHTELMASIEELEATNEELESLNNEVIETQKLLLSSEEQYRLIIENSTSGIAMHELIMDSTGRPVDYVFLSANKAFERHTGLIVSEILGRKVTDVIPGMENTQLIDIYGSVVIGQTPVVFEQYFEPLDRFYSINVYPIDDRRFVCVFEDKTEQKRTELALARMNEQLQLSYEAAGAGSWDWDVKTGRIEWTPKMFELLGIDSLKHGASFDSWRAAVHPDDLATAESNIMAALGEGATLHNEYRVVLPNGEVRWIYAVGRGYYSDTKDPVRMSGICMDITGRMRMEEILRQANEDLVTANEELQQTNEELERLNEDLQLSQHELMESEERFNKIFQYTPIALALSSLKEGRFIDVNAEFLRISGKAREEYIGRTSTGMNIWVHPEQREQMISVLREKGGIHSYEVEIYGKNGEILSVLWSADIVIINNEQCLLTSAIDITTRRHAEDEIQRQLAEKESLLREVNHRIKNNIASIGNMLALQLEATAGIEARNVISDTLGRVESMRKLYEKLLLSGDYGEASVKAYLDDLVRTIVGIFPHSGKITISVECDDIVLGARKLFPLGLISNELVTNAVKYAFPGRESGVIELSLRRKDDEIILVFQDNGRGLPGDFDVSRSGGFGLMLVKMLVEQLRGTVDMGNCNGMRCIIRFRM